MRRVVLAGCAACAFAAMQPSTAVAMPIVPADTMVDGTDSSFILAKGGHGRGGGWGSGSGHRVFGWSHGRKIGWRGRGCPPGLWKQGRC